MSDEHHRKDRPRTDPPRGEPARGAPIDWDGWQIMRLVGHELLREPRLADDEAYARGLAFMARVRSRALGVRRQRAPSMRAPSVEGTAGQVLGEAMRERATPVVDLGVAAGGGRELWDETVEQWVAIPEGVPDGRYLALRIVGDSMAPVMHTGDTVLVRVGPEVEPDTVIVARHPDDGYVCKRVAAVRASRLALASLNPEYPAVDIPNDRRLVVGTVVLVWCTHHPQ